MRRFGLPLLCLVVCAAAPAAAATRNVPADHPTIQAAIDAAGVGDVIQLAPGTYAERIVITDAAAVVTVRGSTADPAQTVIDGGGVADAVVRIQNHTSGIVFEGVTITGGQGGAGLGGGLFMADAYAIFRDCVFAGNASDDGAGAYLLRSNGLFQRCVFRENTARHIAGAVLLNLGSSPLFDHCEFDGNEAGGAADFSGYGGAIVANESSPVFLSCSFHDNQSEYAAGAVAVTAPTYTGTRFVATFRDCDIYDNRVVVGSASDPATEGGGLHVEDNAKVVMERCRVHGNRAHRGGGLNTYRGILEVSDSVIEDNFADEYAGDAGTGAGIYAAAVNTSTPLRDPAEVHLVRTLLRRNQAAYGGGIYAQGDFVLGSAHTIVALTDSIVADNDATHHGGGFYTSRADVILTNTLVLRNEITGLDGLWGGGLLAVDGVNLTITDSTFAGNTTVDQGGAIFMDRGGHLDVSNSRFYDNRAGSSVGGEVFSIGQQDGAAPAPITGTVTNSVIAGDGTSYAIYEVDCDLSRWSTVTFTNNVFHEPNGGIYTRACNGPVASLTAFNALGGKASSNSQGTPTFGQIVAAPGRLLPGHTAVLGAVIPERTQRGIYPAIGGIDPIDTVEVTPTSTTVYTLKSGPTDLDAAEVTVACDGVGTPLPYLPANGYARQPTGTGVTLSWFAATGATTYDVYLDGSAAPSTLVGSGLTDTSLTLPDLATGSTYSWKVVAHGPACSSPVEGPVVSFSTCTTALCEWVYPFDAAGEITDWLKVGTGSARVDGGALSMAGKRAGVMLLLPISPLESSTMRVLVKPGRRREIHLVAAYDNPRTYAEVIGVMPAGKWKVRDRVDGVKRIVTKAKFPTPKTTPFTLRLVAEPGGGFNLYLDDTRVLQSIITPRRGKLAVGVARGTIGIDEVRVVQGVQ